MTKHARFFLLPSFILISAALIAGCNDKGEEKAHVGEPQVTVHILVDNMRHCILHGLLISTRIVCRNRKRRRRNGWILGDVQL